MLTFSSETKQKWPFLFLQLTLLTKHLQVFAPVHKALQILPPIPQALTAFSALDYSRKTAEAAGSGYAGVFCPTSIQNLTAVNYGTGGTPTSPSVSFSVENAFTLFNSGNAVFSTMAGLSSNGSDASFDWGLPFFFGKHVYVGIENTSSSLGAGPYWSY